MKEANLHTIIRNLLAYSFEQAPTFAGLTSDERAIIGDADTYYALRTYARCESEETANGHEDHARDRACVRIENGAAYTYDEDRKGDPEEGPASELDYAVVLVEPFGDSHGKSTVSSLIALESSRDAAESRARLEAAERGIVYERTAVGTEPREALPAIPAAQ